MKDDDRLLKLMRQIAVWEMVFMTTVDYHPDCFDWLDWLKASKN
ncbi:hypothetical protein ACFLV4_04555 [Chloroflexota bacterium]